MDRTTVFNLSLAWIVAIFALAVPALWNGALYLSLDPEVTRTVEELTVRMAGGAMPHRDFGWQSGIFALLPVAMLRAAGLEPGLGFVLSQALLALVLMPALLWLIASRMDVARGFLLGLSILVLVLALVPGGGPAGTGLAGYADRWAWAVAAVLLLFAALRPLYMRSQLLDGLAMGGAVFVLLMLRPAFLLGLLPAVLMVLAHRGQVLALGVGTAVVALGIFAVNESLGYDLIWAYAGDLISAAQAGSDAYERAAWAQALWSPARLPGSLLLLAAVVFLRQGGRRVEGLTLLFAAPGLVYLDVVAETCGQLWLFILGFLLLETMPRRLRRNRWGWDMRQTVGAAGLAALVLAAPIWVNMAYSPFRILLADPAAYRALSGTDLRIPENRQQTPE